MFHSFLHYMLENSKRTINKQPKTLPSIVVLSKEIVSIL